MKRYGLYVKDENGAYQLNGEKYDFVGQVPGIDKADAERGVVERNKNDGKPYVLRYIGKWHGKA